MSENALIGITLFLVFVLVYLITSNLSLLHKRVTELEKRDRSGASSAKEENNG